MFWYCTSMLSKTGWLFVLFCNIFCSVTIQGACMFTTCSPVPLACTLCCTSFAPYSLCSPCMHFMLYQLCPLLPLYAVPALPLTPSVHWYLRIVWIPTHIITWSFLPVCITITAEDLHDNAAWLSTTWHDVTAQRAAMKPETNIVSV